MDAEKAPLKSLNIVLSIGVALLVLAYTFASVTKRIEKIDTTNLIIILVGVVVIMILLRPALFERLQVFEVGGMKIRMLEKQQKQQQSQLEKFYMQMMPMLLPEAERKHLLNLARKRTQGYRGGHSVRTELRRLRTLGLIRAVNNLHISSFADGTTMDLSSLVVLTSLGEQWAELIQHIEKGEPLEAEAGKAATIATP